ncbi:MAG TPA: amidohydrolase [Thermoanaerobaculia bacterium]|nr:amidohydrolase [Thermoanaerobaculia bacterium]
MRLRFPARRATLLASPTLLTFLTTAALGCASAPPPPPAPAAPARPAPPTPAIPPPFPSTYRPTPAPPTLIRNATILTATESGPQRIEGGSILLRDGRIAAVGKEVAAPADAVVVDAAGRWVTPGLIDIHSHLGVYAAPEVEANSDGNELTNPVTANVWAEHSVWPQDPQFPLALAGGVTAMQILPGSGNLIGGRGVTIKNVPARTVEEMKFPGAPYGLKMACGENPKRVYGDKGRAPSTRMGNVAGYREAWIKAAAYRRKWDEYERKKKEGKEVDPPERDLGLETLAGVLRGEILVHTHCYRADEMAVMIDVAKEFGYKIAAFHHAVESYKIADLLAREGICSAMWADWWGFKMEAWDGIRENLAMVENAGACAIVHSDSADEIQRLNQEAAKAMAAGNRAGFPVTREQAIRWITANPAKAMGIDRQTGSLEPGKMADVVVWSGDPFSVYSHAEKVYVDGALLYDRADPRRQPRMDFDLGILDVRGGGR